MKKFYSEIIYVLHPKIVHEYENLKQQLAKDHTYDREEYTKAKTQFIQEILRKAENS